MIEKIVAIIVLILVASLSVAGCTSSNTSPSPSAQAASSAVNTSVSENASTTAQSSSREGVDISVHYLGSPQSIGPFNATPSDGYKWAVYNVTIKDINVTDYLVMDSSFMMNLSNGNLSITQYFVNYTEALGWNNGTMSDVHLQPGETTSGTIVFDVPLNVSPLTVVYERAYIHGMVYGDDIRKFDALAR